MDGDWPAIIGPGDCFILAGPAQDFIFEVTTDENGCFNSTWTNVSYNQGTYVDFVGVKFVEAKGSIYGDGVVVTGSAQSGGVITQLYTDGEKAGYTRSYVVWSGGCSGTLTVAAGAAAGLKANTTYTVTLSMEMDGAFPAVIGPGDCFIFAGPTQDYIFEVTTDENGEFNQTWTNVYYNEGSYLDIVGVSFEAKKASVYGDGVVVAATGSNLTAETKEFEGDKAGYTRTYASYSYCADGTLTVAVVDAKVGLKANTKYHVVLSMEMDGGWPAIIGPGDCFIFAGPAQDFIFEVTTDENGCFNSTWTNVSYNQGTYVDFVGVKFVEAKGSIYGDGVVVTGSAQSGGVITQLYTDGEKAGYTRSYVVWSGGCSGTLTVAAGAAAGLKANTTYTVTLSMEMDGAFPAVIGPGDCFIFAGPTQDYIFEVTTDENGEFNQTWTNVYYNEGSYLDIVGVSITEKAE